MADDNDKIGQNEIEELLRMAQATAVTPPAAPPAASAAPEPAAGSASLGQDEIESLLRGSAASPAAAPARATFPAATASPAATAPPRAAPAPAASRAPAASEPPGGLGDIDILFQQAEQALASVDRPVDAGVPGMAPFQLRDFVGTPPSADQATLNLLRDVELDLKIELGRTRMHLEDVLRLRRGAVVPLDKLAGDPVDVYVNGRLVARGEVLVLNDNFCVRVAELVESDQAG